MLLWANGRLVAPKEKPEPYPAPASISTFFYHTIAADEVPGCEYFEPYEENEFLELWYLQVAAQLGEGERMRVEYAAHLGTLALHIF